MGSSLCKIKGTKPRLKEPGLNSLTRFDDDYAFPLDDQDIASIPDEQLRHLYDIAPHLHRYGRVTVARISKSLVIKGGSGVMSSESQNMILASDILHLPVPKVHRAFTAGIPNASRTGLIDGHFIVIDYISEPTVETCWKSLDSESQLLVVQQVANMIDIMQSRSLNDHPPGPIGRGENDKFQGPRFTDYGAGPFDTLRELEDWCNHKIDVGIMVNQLPADAPRFCFRDVVLTHQDIAERNMMLDKDNKVWLVDWGCAGVYPRGFEQAVLRDQSDCVEFADMVLARLQDRQDEMATQFSSISYGFSTGRRL